MHSPAEAGGIRHAPNHVRTLIKWLSGSNCKLRLVEGCLLRLYLQFPVFTTCIVFTSIPGTAIQNRVNTF
eukprot:9204095-Pyramimonas_sp.AAC.1